MPYLLLSALFSSSVASICMRTIVMQRISSMLWLSVRMFECNS